MKKIFDKIKIGKVAAGACESALSRHLKAY
jgi:hypothetical protein